MNPKVSGAVPRSRFGFDATTGEEMNQNTTYAGLVAGMFLLIGFVGCAVEQPSSFVAGNGTVEQQIPDLDSNALQGSYICIQKEGWLTATSPEGTTTNCGPLNGGTANPCLPEKGCEPYKGTTPAPSNLGVATSALVLDDGNINPLGDARGNCAPINMIWCGDATLANGQAYAGRWICMAWIGQDGQVMMKGVEMACDAGDSCEITGAYPSYGQCIAPVECTADADCNDNVQCTTDRCVDGACVRTPKFGTADATCDDGEACTVNDMCNAFNQCVSSPKSCDDGNDCTNDVCDQENGACANVALPDSAACDDGSACTLQDACLTGHCMGVLKSCDDSNPCTTDTCDAITGACANVALPDASLCDDGSACTLQDACQAGECVGAPKACDDANTCTNDTCDDATGSCLNTGVANGTVCGLPAAHEVCVNSACQSNWCARGDQPECRQDLETQTIGYWQCQIAAGADFGIWVELQLCGAIGNSRCIAGTGCLNPGVREVACHDGVDNDGDGKVDCADLDCAGLDYCQPVIVCHAQVECPANEGCCTGGNICAPECFIPPVPPACVDNDRDGYDNCAIEVQGGDALVVDCDDSNAAKHPSSVEACDGLDNDCDSSVDNQIAGAALLCAAGQVCTAGHCVVGPECGPGLPACPAGEFCAAGTCADGQDLHGRTGNGQSGATVGTSDQNPDQYDRDGDCFCALDSVQIASGLKCLGTSAPAGTCQQLLGGDCDDTVTGAANKPGAVDWPGDNYDNNCDGVIL